MTEQPVISHIQAAPLLKARRHGDTDAETSLDLGLSKTTARLTHSGCVFEAGTLLWEDLGKVADSDNACYTLESSGERLTPKKIFFVSEETRRHVSLYPTKGAPALLVAGFPMHRIKHVDPMEDTKLKIRAAQPSGIVLDTSMGLGYTAIEASKRAQKVITVELDPAVVETAKLNPWSRELFTNPRIERRLGDSAEVIEDFEPDSFTRIIHDPPTMALSGDLYSGEYYRGLYRILRRSGRLFHYIGDLNSASGARIVPGVIKRLEAAGFKNVAKRPEAFGVIAFK